MRLREVAFAAVPTGAEDFTVVSEAVCVAVDDSSLFDAELGF